VLVGIANELGIPVRYVGVGEKMDDLRDFSARAFADALFAESETPRAG
jgi:fused signal recognition particle receptor